MARRQAKLASDLRSEFHLSRTVSDYYLASYGNGICRLRSSGKSQAYAITTAESYFGTSISNASAMTLLAERDLCPRYLPAPSTSSMIATFTGSGDENTAPFSVPGNWVLKWHYSCSAGDGGSGTFIVNEDNGQDKNGADVNEHGAGGTGETHVYGDAGDHYLSVTAWCNWKIQVVA